MLLKCFLAVVGISSFAFGATQTFYQTSVFNTNVFLHDTNMPVHSRLLAINTNLIFLIDRHVTDKTNPHAVTAAQIGAATGSPLYEFAEVDPAYATGAVHLTGSTMTGPLTNEHGYFGDGSGLTNLASDPAGWSGYAATQQVVWYEEADSESIDTNILVLSNFMEPDIAGTICRWNPVLSGYDNTNMEISVVDSPGEALWRITYAIPSPASTWVMGYTGLEPVGDSYGAETNSTGVVTAAYGLLKATNTWRAGYDTNSGAWAISRNGTNVQAWFPSSNVMAGPVVIGGVQRDTWPSEYDDSAIYGALNTVSNWTIAGSNLAATVAGNLSVVSNWTVAASNLSANALPTTGGTMAGPLTNEHGYFGDGSGLTNLPGSTPFDGTELSNSVAGLGILITNAAEQATNYADSVGSAVGLVASNALPMNGGGTVTGDVAVTGGVTAGTLALTNGPVAGSVWVCTNANGSGELRQLGKMTLSPLGSEVYSGFYGTNKWSSTPALDIGDMVASENGITVTRNGTYLVSMLFNVTGVTNPAQFMRAHITLNDTRAYSVYGPMSSTPHVETISCGQSICVGANSGQTFGVQYYIYDSSVGQTNRVNHGHLSVIELP